MKYLLAAIDIDGTLSNSNKELSVLIYVGMGVAVVNATEPAKDAADLITMSNNEDGVAHVIDMML